jgi:tRNA threonylcarbamoyladenosine biosynthesis protein TsaB
VSATGGLGGPFLALEASTLRPSVALLGPGGERWGQWMPAQGQRGTAPLAPAISELLAARGTSVAALAGVVVGLGPGSYTGTRAIIALARGLVFGSGAPLAGVPSVAAAARAELAARPQVERVVVLVDARRGERYRADYARAPAGPAAGAGLVELQPPRLVSAAEPDPPDGAAISVLREPIPCAYDVGAVGMERLLAGGDAPAAVRPLYLKRSHAEIVFDERVGPAGPSGLG